MAPRVKFTPKRGYLAINHLRQYITELERIIQKQNVLIGTLQGSIEAYGSFVRAMRITHKGTPNFSNRDHEESCDADEDVSEDVDPEPSKDESW